MPEADKSTDNPATAPEAVPLTSEALMAVTELALIGHKYLKALLLGGKLDALDLDAVKAAAAKRHYQILVETAGPAALKTFDRLSQFLFEQSAAKSPATTPPETKETR